MNLVTAKLGAVLLCINSFLAVGVLAQTVPDCIQPRPTLAGHWKDDLNGEEVIITTTYQFSRVTAIYAKQDKSCRDPDIDGNPVPFQTDFDANFTNGSTIEGHIYWCDTMTKDGKTYTTGVAQGNITLKVGKDMKTLSGTFHGRNGVESISFTNISKEKEFKIVIVRTKPGAKVYEQPSDTSRVLHTPAAGTKVAIEHVIYDAAGNPSWFAVSNGGPGNPDVNAGFIPAAKVQCNPPSGPVSQIAPEEDGGGTGGGGMGGMVWECTDKRG